MRLAVAAAVTVLALPAPAAAAPADPGDAGLAPALDRVLADPGDAGLAPALDRVLADPRLAGATVVADVREEATGATVYTRDPGRRVLPASNQKLLTAAAALEILGPAHRFRTEVRHTGERSAGTLRGDLFLIGQGNPTMSYAHFDALARSVAAAGVTRVTGRLLGDAGWFDDVPLGLDWSWQDEPYAGSAPISALTFTANDRLDNGSVEIRYRPGPSGGPPVISVHPPTATIRVRNRAVTANEHTLKVTRQHGTGTVLVTGSVRNSGTELVAVPDPARTAVDIFGAALRRHGIAFSGRTTKGLAPETARLLTAQVSDPLADLLPELLKLSNNGLAELLVKAMSRAASPGVPGSWPGGLAAMAGALRRLGVDPAVLTLGDGSGLSRRNGVTARQLTSILLAVRERPWFASFRAALPVAADPDPMIGGTLRDRMRGTAAAGVVRAKTGTLTGVNALSGYVAGDRRLVFSVIVNNAVTPVSEVVDRFASTLARAGLGTESVRNRHYRSGRDRANARPPNPQPRHPGPAAAAGPGRSQRAGGAHPARRAAGADAAQLVRGVVEPAPRL